MDNIKLLQRTITHLDCYRAILFSPAAQDVITQDITALKEILRFELNAYTADIDELEREAAEIKSIKDWLGNDD